LPVLVKQVKNKHIIKKTENVMLMIRPNTEDLSKKPLIIKKIQLSIREKISVFRE